MDILCARCIVFPETGCYKVVVSQAHGSVRSHKQVISGLRSRGHRSNEIVLASFGLSLVSVPSGHGLDPCEAHVT
jgi:hypothetical protein